jgi:hypothetical protein
MIKILELPELDKNIFYLYSKESNLNMVHGLHFWNIL